MSRESTETTPTTDGSSRCPLRSSPLLSSFHSLGTPHLQITSQLPENDPAERESCAKEDQEACFVSGDVARHGGGEPCRDRRLERNDLPHLRKFMRHQRGNLLRTAILRRLHRLRLRSPGADFPLRVPRGFQFTGSAQSQFQIGILAAVFNSTLRRPTESEFGVFRGCDRLQLALPVVVKM